MSAGPDRQCAAFAARLGVADLWETQYVEFRLRAGQEQLDYLFSITRPAASALADTLESYATELKVMRDLRWVAVLRLLNEWADGYSPICPRAPVLWLEFDAVNCDGPYRTPPSVSLCLIPGYRFDRPLNPAVGDRDLRTANACLDALGIETTAELRSTLTRSFEALPLGGRFIHISVMLGREPAAVKLYGTIPRAQLPCYLRKIDWSGDLHAVSSLLEVACGEDAMGDQLFLDLSLNTVADPACCTLGLAVAQQHLVSGPDRDPTRARLLERWVDAGLACARKATSVRNWLEPVSGFGRRQSRFVDLKLVWQAGRDPSAKAYLGSYRPRAFA